MNQKSEVTIFVELLNEGTPCWRPVKALSLGDGTYRILTKRDPGDEEWAFEKGDTVICKEKVFQESGKTELVADELAR